MDKFKIHSKFKPTGDQPEAIKTISDAIKRNEKFSTLLGVTGSGKTLWINLKYIQNSSQQVTSLKL